MHKQEEPGQIPDTAGERNQNTQGKSELLRNHPFPTVPWFAVVRLLYIFSTLKQHMHISVYEQTFV